jgi:hypothetical protein
MYTIRNGKAEDLHLVLDSWVKTYAQSPYARAMGRVGSKKTLFFQRTEARVRALLQACPVKVACDEVDEDVVIGWACGNPPYLHYVFVKSDFRKKGIAKDLVRSLGFEESELCLVGSQTDLSKNLKLPEKWSWDPMAPVDTVLGYALPKQSTSQE